MTVRRWEALPLIALCSVVLYRAFAEIQLWRAISEAEVSGALGLPLLAFWIPVAAITILSALTGVTLALRRRGAQNLRACTATVFLLLAADLLFIPATRLPSQLSADLISGAALELLGGNFSQALPESGLGAPASELETLLEEELQRLGIRPSYLVHGVRVSDWHTKILYDCSGPSKDPAGLSVATIILCVESSRARAWLSVVGSGGALAGEANVARNQKGEVISVVVMPPARSALKQRPAHQPAAPLEEAGQEGSPEN